jgi:alkylhydroperoxidase family enzyme
VRASDETWGAVREFLDDGALAELVLIVGFYNMVARFLEPAQVDLDPRYTG